MKSYTKAKLLLLFLLAPHLPSIEWESNKLNDDQLIGQTLIMAIRYDGEGRPVKSLNKELSKQIEKIQPGGVIIYAQNMTDAGQITNLVAQIQSLLKIPAFIAIDEEGGRVSRLKSTPKLKTFAVPSALALSKLGPDGVKLGYSIIGKNLRSLGITMDFAPVLDLAFYPDQDFLGDRSFSKDPQKVTDFGKIAVDALQNAKVLAVAKHFPGIGRAVGDPHVGSFSIRASKKDLEQDFFPFYELSKSRVGGFLLSHLVYTGFDNQNLPASLNRGFYDLARGPMNFSGLLITDSLEMGGIKIDESVAALKALNAGADMVMGPHNSSTVFEALKKSLASKTLKLEELEAKVERILEAKRRFNLMEFKNFAPNLKAIEETLRGGKLEEELASLMKLPKKKP